MITRWLDVKSALAGSDAQRYYARALRFAVDTRRDKGQGAPVTDPASIVLAAVAWLRLFTCTDGPEDAGGVRCASFAAATVLAPWPGGARQGGAFLAAVARHESHSRPVGVHRRDTWAARRMWRRAVTVGWLDPKGCPGHRSAATVTNRSGDDPADAGWGVRGAWGVSAAYAARWLGPVGCLLGPAVLDVSAFGALAAAGHARHCATVRRTRDPDELRLCWAGRAKRRSDVLRRWHR